MTVTKTWTGGTTGDFNAAGNWSPSGIPDATNVVLVNTASTVEVSNNQSDTIDHLTLDAGAQLDVGSGHFVIENAASSLITGALVVDNADLLVGNGFLDLVGNLNLLDGANLQTTGSSLDIGTDFLQSSTLGTILLQGGNIGGRVATGGAGTFDTLVVEVVVHGSGVIGKNSNLLDDLHLVVNGGSIVADVPGLQLILQDVIANNGYLFASNGGTLVTEGAVDQTQSADSPGSGQISAGGNSTVLLDTGLITSGDLNVDNTSTLEVGTNVTLDGGTTTLSLQGVLTVMPGATLDLTRTVLGTSISDATIDASSGTLILNGATVSLEMLWDAAHFELIGNGNDFEQATLQNALTVAPDQTVSFDDTSTNAGTITLNGSFDTGDVDHSATMVVGVGVSVLTEFVGGGTISLPDPGDRITGTAGVRFLSDIDNSILGIGTIDNVSDFTIGAGATVEAVGNGQTLVVDAATIDNSGFLGASPHSTLLIEGKLNNTGVLGTQGTVLFGSPNAGFADGTLVAGQTVEILAGSFDGMTNAGVINVLAGGTLSVMTALINSGAINLAGITSPGAIPSGAAVPAGASPTTMQVSGGATTLSGGGTVTLHQPAVIDSATTADVLVNVDNIIEGSGSVGGGFLNLINFATIDATDPAAPLVVNGGTLLDQNLGLMEATTGTLSVQGALLDTDIVNGTISTEFTGVGTLLANGAGAVVGLDGGSVAEGLINSTNGGSVLVRGPETLLLGSYLIPDPSTPQPYARDSVLTNYADLGVLAGQTLTLAPVDPGAKGGVLDNYGSISLPDAAGGGATLVIAGSIDLTAEQVGATSGGNGTLTLGNVDDRVVGAVATDTLQNDETIEGFGQLGGGSLDLINQALIEATGATPLIIHASGTFSENGTLAINGDGGVVLEGTVFADFGQFRSVGGTGAFVLGGADGGADVLGGQFPAGTMILSSANTSTIDGSGKSAQNAVTNLGTFLIQSGQTLDMLGQITNFGSVIVNAGSVEVSSGPFDNEGTITVENSGTFFIASSAALMGNGRVLMETGSTTEIASPVETGTGIYFSDPATLILDDPSSFAGTIGGFAIGDAIQLANEVITSGSITGTVLDLTLAGGGTQALTVAPFQSGMTFAATASGGLEVACFAAGTRIATARGEVAVDALRAGDFVALASGGEAPVQWLGHRRIDCRRHPAPASVWPVRVRAGAFGAARPARDLLLSPDHAVFAGGVLLPVRYLINGGSVVQEAVDAITYFHVELPAHGVLLAEGLPAESYLDTGNRDAFEDDNGAIETCRRYSPPSGP